MTLGEGGGNALLEGARRPKLKITRLILTAFRGSPGASGSHLDDTHHLPAEPRRVAPNCSCTALVCGPLRLVTLAARLRRSGRAVAKRLERACQGRRRRHLK